MKRQSGNLVAVVIAQVVIGLTGLVIQIALARMLGEAGFGSYRFLAGLAGLTGFLADFSIPLLLAAQVARAPDRAGERYGSGLAAIALLALPPILITAAYTWFADGRPEIIAAAFVAGATMGALASQGIGESIFQGLQRMRPLAWANLCGRLVYLVAVFALLWAGLGVMGAFLAAVLGPMVAALVLLFTFRRQVGALIAPTSGAVGRLMVDGVPFGLHRAFMGVYLAGDVLVIQWLRTDAELGAYGVAAVLLLQLPLAKPLIKALYPTLSQLVGSPAEAGAHLGLAIRLLLVASLPIAVGGMLVAHELVPAVFGSEFAAAVPLLIGLLPVIPLRFTSLTAGSALSALERQGSRTRGIIAIALFNVGLNVVLVPSWGAMGAVIATAIAEVFLLAWIALSLRGAASGVGAHKGVLAALPGLVLMAGVVWLGSDFHVFVRIIAGGAVYGIVSYLTRAWTLDDLRGLARL